MLFLTEEKRVGGKRPSRAIRIPAGTAGNEVAVHGVRNDSFGGRDFASDDPERTLPCQLAHQPHDP